MSDIFISYARKDKERVKPLARALETHGWSVWWDTHIPSGNYFDEVIENALKEARCIVVVWSSNSVSSRWVRTEANEGLRQGTLIPVLIEETEIPLRFREIQTANLIDWDGSLAHAEFEKLTSDISLLLGPSAVTTSAPVLPAPHPEPSKKPLEGSKWENVSFSLGQSFYKYSPRVIATSVAVVLLTILVAWVINSTKQDSIVNNSNNGNHNNNSVTIANNTNTVKSGGQNTNGAGNANNSSERGKLRIATWHIYWLGDDGVRVARTSNDEQLIAEVIKKLSPDVLAIQGVVNPKVLERIVKLASKAEKDYTIRSNDGTWLTADPVPTNNLLKVFFCINRQAIEFVKGAAINVDPEKRKPYAVTLRHRSSGREFVAVAVHLRSGFPSFHDKDDANARKAATTALARWLRGETKSENPKFPDPGSDLIVVLGDFNAEISDPNESLAPLRNLSDWIWKNPESDGDRRETVLGEDHPYITDFIMLSPALGRKIIMPPTIYAWDYDPDLGGPAKFHENGGRLGNSGFKVSTHRPVFAVLDF